MKPILKVIHNKIQADESRENGLKVYPMEEILGSMATVKEFATFGMKNKENMEVLRASLLLDYCEGEFTPEELRAFRMGLDSMLQAFKNSESDTKLYLADNAQKNTKSVG